MSTHKGKCPRCAQAVLPSDRFCEGCGNTLSVLVQVAIPRPGRSTESVCTDCGGDVFTDDYCTACGNLRAEPDRDEVDVGGIALITDRGIEHTRNEDCAAAGVARAIGTRRSSVAVTVCDGVSTSSAAHTAASAASSAGVDAMLAALAACRTGAAAVLAGLTHAARAAAKACGPDTSVAPSCTYTGAVVIASDDGSVRISVGNVGDSRAYWLPDPPGAAEQLTVDDSVAQELITAGAHEGSDAVRAGAHVLTRWLGADADSPAWADTGVRTITATEPGTLVLCTDGLWNYLPGADQIARFCSGADAAATARALVDYALSAGGHDNITVAVIPIGGYREFS